MNEIGINQIKLADEEKEIDVSEFSQYKTVFFYWCNIGYTWTAIPKRGGTYKGKPLEDYPREANGRRKGYKTLAGAKRNFIKQA